MLRRLAGGMSRGRAGQDGGARHGSGTARVGPAPRPAGCSGARPFRAWGRGNRHTQAGTEARTGSAGLCDRRCCWQQPNRGSCRHRLSSTPSGGSVRAGFDRASREQPIHRRWPIMSTGALRPIKPALCCWEQHEPVQSSAPDQWCPQTCARGAIPRRPFEASSHGARHRRRRRSPGPVIRHDGSAVCPSRADALARFGRRSPCCLTPPGRGRDDGPTMAAHLYDTNVPAPR